MFFIIKFRSLQLTFSGNGNSGLEHFVKVASYINLAVLKEFAIGFVSIPSFDRIPAIINLHWFISVWRC